jgi:hypothetical protein
VVLLHLVEHAGQVLERRKLMALREDFTDELAVSIMRTT